MRTALRSLLFAVLATALVDAVAFVTWWTGLPHITREHILATGGTLLVLWLFLAWRALKRSARAA